MRRYDVVIVGGGPTGLAAACTLARQGVNNLLVLEREAQAGGVPRHCGHGGFGWDSHYRWWNGPQFAQRLRDECQQAGVALQLQTSVIRLGAEGELHLRSLKGSTTLQARRVLLATGARETPRAARLVGGSRPQGVMNTGALQQHVYGQHHRPFQRPLIVGSEWVSYSAIMTCRHLGIQPVAMIESAPRPVAPRGSGLLAQWMWGVPLWCNTQLVSIEGHTQVEAVVLRQHGKERTLACDGVVFTGQFRPEDALLPTHPLGWAQPAASALATNPSGGPLAPFALPLPGYYAAGNLLMPIKRSGQCYRQGVAAAQTILESL